MWLQWKKRMCGCSDSAALLIRQNTTTHTMLCTACTWTGELISALKLVGVWDVLAAVFLSRMKATEQQHDQHALAVPRPEPAPSVPAAIPIAPRSTPSSQGGVGSWSSRSHPTSASLSSMRPPRSPRPSADALPTRRSRSKSPPGGRGALQGPRRSRDLREDVAGALWWLHIDSSPWLPTAICKIRAAVAQRGGGTGGMARVSGPPHGRLCRRAPLGARRVHSCCP